MGEFRHNSHFEQYKKGDRILLGRHEAVLVSDAYYRSTHAWGSYFADVLWDDERSVQQGFMICRVDIKWKPLSEVEDATWTEVKQV